MSDKKNNAKPYGLILTFTAVIIPLICVVQIGVMYAYSKFFKNNSDIGALSSFYSVIFTIVAIIIGIVAIIGWHWIRDEWAKTKEAVDEKIKELIETKNTVNQKISELTDKTKKLEELEEIVYLLREKKDLAIWAQELFDKDDKKRIISSAELPLLSPDDKNKYERIKEKIIEEATDDGWLMIVYAKKLMEFANKKSENMKRFSQDEKKNILLEIEEAYRSVIKIFEFIENRDLFKIDSDIEMTLYNLQGKVYWEWYKAEKLTEKEWEIWWQNEEIQGKLKKSIEYYQKALNIQDQKKDNADETLGNLALVYIELWKFSPKLSMIELENAIKQLEKRDKKDFNTYWDHARALYYINPDENDKKIKDLLNDTTSTVSYKFCLS